MSQADSQSARVLDALMVEPARMLFEAAELQRSVSPRRVRRLDYLEAWEAALDITPVSDDIAARAQQVAARIKHTRDHTLSAYEAAAAAWGFMLVGVRMPAPQFQAGHARAGDRAYGDSWLYAFVFELGYGSAPLVAQVLADFRALSRAHTFLTVAWLDAPPAGPAILRSEEGQALVTDQGEVVIRG